MTERLKSRLKSKYGPWAIVTGASSGIGEEISCRLAEAGLNLVLVARSHAKLLEMQRSLGSKWQVDIKLVPVDVASPGAMAAVLQAADGLELGLLVASAGFGSGGAFLKTDLADEMNMVDVNCKALLEITHHFSRKFANQKRGGIILMSSMVAFQGVPFSSNYAATKAYVQSLAEGLHSELKPYGVDVLAAAPGPVQSGFSARADMRMSMSLSPEQVGVPILKALGRKGTVLPGFLTKLLVYSLRTVPRWGKIRIMKLVMGGMVKHQG